MTEEEWQDEVRRRDEIIDANKGIELDFLYAESLPGVNAGVSRGKSDE
jgi:hypothetical protein